MTSLLPSWVASYDLKRQGTSDLTAGLTTAVILIPQAMAYAMLAGLPPQVGLYAAIVPMLAYALIGGSRQLSVGPVAMDSMLVLTSVSALATVGSETYIATAVLLALLVGLLQIAMGALRLGAFVNLLSRPVLTGFTAAAALIIGASQLRPLLGLQFPRTSAFHETIWTVLNHLTETHLPTFVIGAVAVVLLVALKLRAPKAPRALIVLVLATAAAALLGGTVQTVGAVPAGLPAFQLPTLNDGLASVITLLPAALAIAMVSFMESISVGQKFAAEGGYDLSPNRELVGVGFSNVAGSFFGAYPVAGGLSRSAVNASAGATSPLASVITAATIALSLLFLTPYFNGIPLAVLAAIILTAVSGFIDVEELRDIGRTKRKDLLVLFVTFSVTLAFGIQIGIGVGVALSIALFVLQTTAPHVAFLGRMPGTTAYRNVANHPEAVRIPGVCVVRVDAQLYFGNVSALRETLAQCPEACRVSGPDPMRTVLIDASGINQLDSSATAALKRLVTELGEEQPPKRVVFANLKQPVRTVMQRSGLFELLGENSEFLTIHDAIMHITAQDSGLAPLGVAPAEPAQTAPQSSPTNQASIMNALLSEDDYTRNHAGVREVSVAWLHATLPKLTTADASPAVLLVDVRQAAELSGPLGALPDAIHAPLGELESYASTWPRDALIALICRGGHRSATAARLLQELGFSQVVSVAGGMTGYRQLYGASA